MDYGKKPELAWSNNGGAEEGSRRAVMGVQGSDVTFLNRAAALRVARRNGQQRESNF